MGTANGGAGRPALRLLIVNTVPTEINGQTAFIFKYLRHLPLESMQAGYVSINPLTENLRAELDALGIRSYQIPDRNRNPLAYFLRLLRLVRREGYNIVHAHGNSATMAVEMWAALLGGAKVRAAQNHSGDCTYRRLNRLLNPLFQAAVNAPFACSGETAKWMFGDRPCTVLRSASDPEVYRFDSERRASVRGAMGIGSDEILAGCVAMFDPVKNHSFLLDAFQKARARNPRLRLALIGDGPRRAELEAGASALGISDSVIFTGAVRDVPDRLQALDAILLPSLSEGFPNVLVEAQLAGLPGLVSEAVTRDIDMNGRLAFLPLEEERWAQALAGLEQCDRPSASAAACDRAAELGLDVSLEARKLRDLYVRLLS